MSYSSTILGETGLIAYYRCDDSSGGSGHPVDTTGSHSGVGITLAGGGGAYGVTGLISGDANTAITFGFQDFMKLVTDGGGWILGGNTNFSVEMWLKGTTTGGAVLALYSEYSSTASNLIALQTVTNAQTQLSFSYKGRLGSSGGATSASGLSLPNGSPHHVVITKSGTAGQIYFDGVASGSAATFDADNTFDNPGNSRVRIGNWFDSGSFTLTGWTVDEAALYTVALTPTQVANHYSLGTGGGGAVSTSGLLGIL